MREVVLSNRKDADSVGLLKALKESESRRGRVYCTVVVVQELSYHLLTTSKDVHLAIGRLLWKHQFQFATLLFKELQANPNGFLFFIDEAEEARGLMVTQVHNQSSSVVLIHLSPA